MFKDKVFYDFATLLHGFRSTKTADLLERLECVCWYFVIICMEYLILDSHLRSRNRNESDNSTSFSGKSNRLVESALKLGLLQELIENSINYIPNLVADNVISSIGPGLCVLIGISRTDTEKDVEFM